MTTLAATVTCFCASYCMSPIKGYQVAGLLMAGVLAACSQVSPHKSTVAELAQTQH